MRNFHCKFHTLGCVICLCGAAILSGCKAKSDKEIISELILEYAKKNIPDYESFEIVELSEWDSVYTELYKDNAIRDYASSCNNILSNITSSKEKLQKINNYLEELKPFLKQAESNELSAFFGMNEHLGYNQYGGERRGVTMRGLNNYSRAKDELEKLKKYKSEAQTMKKQTEQQLKELIEQEKNIKDEVRMFCSNWEKQYLGKSTLLKCRFKNKEGNLDLGVYDVLCNDSLTKVISVTDTTERNRFVDLKGFISYCNQ